LEEKKTSKIERVADERSVGEKRPNRITRRGPSNKREEGKNILGDGKGQVQGIR